MRYRPFRLWGSGGFVILMALLFLYTPTRAQAYTFESPQSPFSNTIFALADGDGLTASSSGSLHPATGGGGSCASGGKSSHSYSKVVSGDTANYTGSSTGRGTTVTVCLPLPSLAK